MKKGFTLKLTTLLFTLALSFALAFAFYGAKPAFAASVTSPSAYFGGTYQSLEFKDDNLVATVKTGNTLSFNNFLVIDDFEMQLVVPSEIKEVKITLNSGSYFVNGAFNSETEEFDDSIDNVISFDTSTDTDNIKLNGVTASAAIVAGDIIVGFSVDENGVLSATVGGETLVNTEDYYKIKGADKHAAKISFEFTLNDDDGEPAEFAVAYVDQYAGETGYKQTFELEDGKIKTVAKPRVAINSLPMKKNAGKLIPVKDYRYSLSFTTYSVFGIISSGNVYVDKDSVDASVVWVDPSSDNPKYVSFSNDSEITFEIRCKDRTDTAYTALETYTVAQAQVRANDGEAPVYIDYTANENLYANYRKLVEKAAVKEYTDDDGSTVTRSIRLGDSYEIPSLENLVTDNYDVYSSLSYTVYYRTPTNASGTATSLRFTVSEAGDYEFFVIFKDKAGNEMNKDDFYVIDEDDDNKINGVGNINEARENPNAYTLSFGGELLDVYPYFMSVFTFTVEDDAPLYVISPSSKGVGYLNTKYTAPEFKIQSSGNNITYTLYYNADADATADSEGWVKIPQLSEITEDYDDVFKYSDIEKIGYDGAYTFTPIKKGAYKIDCYVTSDNSVRFADGNTVISVTESPTVVKVDTHWLRNNIWSVVFLSIGTLALIGIVVLLFIKPKEETETDETGEALKAKSNDK